MILNDTFRACVAHPGIVSVASTSKETGAHIANTWNKYLIITLPEHHSGDAVVLRDHDVAFFACVRHGDVHRIRARADHMDIANLRLQNMVCITIKMQRHMIFLCNALDLRHDGTSVRINKNLKRYYRHPLSPNG